MSSGPKLINQRNGYRDGARPCGHAFETIPGTAMKNAKNVRNKSELAIDDRRSLEKPAVAGSLCRVAVASTAATGPKLVSGRKLQQKRQWISNQLRRFR